MAQLTQVQGLSAIISNFYRTCKVNWIGDKKVLDNSTNIVKLDVLQTEGLRVWYLPE